MGLVNPTDGHIDPYSLTMAYATGARMNGAEIFQNCPVQDIRNQKDGSWEVVTPRGTFQAKRIINAAGKSWIGSYQLYHDSQLQNLPEIIRSKVAICYNHCFCLIGQIVICRYFCVSF